jgi:type VI secretion system protein ImpK
LQRSRAEAPPPPPPAAAAPDDFVKPALEFRPRNLLISASAPLLTLLASVRAGRVRMALPELHGKVFAAIEAFKAQTRGQVSEETARRAVYALAATADDIALNLPGQESDAAEWARRGFGVQFFQEAIGGDRFWRLLDEMLARPADYVDVLELYHACMAAGFEGRYRVMPDGRRAHQELMARAFRALPHAAQVSGTQLSPRWRGADAPATPVSFWSPLILAAVAASGLLLVIYIGLRLILAGTGQSAIAALDEINPQQPLRLSRQAPAAPPPSDAQAQRIATFLAPEIQQGLVKVIEDASTVRVRTTVGQLFQSGSDVVLPERRALFQRIGAALNTEPGVVHIEGYTDAAKLRGLTFPDNISLSKARAEAAAAIIRGSLQDPTRIVTEGYGADQPIAPNDTPAGMAQNRRVEVVVERRS